MLARLFHVQPAFVAFLRAQPIVRRTGRRCWPRGWGRFIPPALLLTIAQDAAYDHLTTLTPRQVRLARQMALAVGWAGGDPFRPLEEGRAA